MLVSSRTLSRSIFAVFLLFLVASLLRKQRVLTLPILQTQHQAEPRTFLLVAADGFQAAPGSVQEFFLESVENKRDYANRHNYIFIRNDLSGWSKPSDLVATVWAKVWAINETLQLLDDGDHLWYIDTDAVILQKDFSIESHVLGSRIYCEAAPTLQNGPQARFLPAVECTAEQRDKLALIISRDCNGFNAGSILFRKSNELQILMDNWLSPLFQHIRMEHEEQDVLEILYFLRPQIKELIGFVDQRVFNAFPTTSCAGELRYWPAGQYQIGDFVVHLAGCGTDKNCQELWTNYTTAMPQARIPENHE